MQAVCDVGAVEFVPEPGATLLAATALLTVAGVRRLRLRA
jgi:hypothetical protein